MKSCLNGALAIIFLLLIIMPCQAAPKIKVKKNWFYIDGEPILIKGIGYSNCRPNEHPRAKKISLKEEAEDFKAIREAGFNTIRTWSPLSLEELKLAEEYGLYVIQGNWIEYRDNFADPEKVAEIVANLKSKVLESSEASNVLMYLVGNEPQPRQVFSIGLKKTNKFFKELKDSIKDISSKLPVAMSNWVQSDFLDDHMWDVAALNIYIYNPESVSHSMGYRGYVDWLKRERARKRPFIITEFGLSVSKTGVGHKGYGGNSEEEQNDGILYMYKEALAGGANGVCVFEWIDEWWKNFNHPSDHKIHEPNDPEEWFGICYYDEDGKLNKRPVYESLRKFNQAICLTPKDSERIRNNFEVSVFVEDSIKDVQIKVGESSTYSKIMKTSPHWFKGKIKLKSIENGKQTLYIKAKSTDEEFEIQKTVYIDKKNKMLEPYTVEIILDKDIYYTQNKMSTVRLRFLVKDAKNRPVPGQKITASIYEPVLNQKLVLNLTSADDGIATHFYNINEEGILTVAAGIQAYPIQNKDEDLKFANKYGDCKHIKIYYEKKK